MFKSKRLIFVIIFGILLIECSRGSSNGGESSNPDTTDTIDYGFEFIDKKFESAGMYTNRMDLYFPTRNFDPGNLDELCRLNRKTTEVTGFYYLVVFDKKENAVFPNSPLSALYGIDEEQQKHIIAVYISNMNNNYSKVSTYVPNMWDGKAKTYEVY
jgi:hypothetical protein